MPEQPVAVEIDHQEVGPDTGGPYRYAPGPYQDQTMLSLKQDQMDMFRPSPSFYSSDLSSFDNFTRAAQRPLEPQPPAHGLSCYSTAPYEQPHVYTGPHSLQSQTSLQPPDQYMGNSMHQDPCNQRHPVYSISTEADPVQRLPLQVLSQSFSLNQPPTVHGVGQGIDQMGMNPGMSQRSGALGLSQSGYHSGGGLSLVGHQGSMNTDLQRLHVPARSPYSSKPMARPYGPSGGSSMSLKKPSTRHSKHGSQVAPLPHKSLELSHKRPSAVSTFAPGVQPEAIRMQCDRNKQIYERACTEIMDFHAKIKDIERRMAHLGGAERHPMTAEQ